MSIINASGTLYLRDTGTTKQYSTNNINWTTITWPVRVINTNVSSTLIVLFTTNITLTGNTQYFICGSDNIQFGSTSLNSDGTRPIIIISSSANAYPGLIQNGSVSIDGKNNIYVYNLIVNGTSATLVSGGGWIGQVYFSKVAINNIIVNCSSMGNISSGGGGIIGRSSALDGGNITIIGCNSSGNMNGGGGIVGGNAATSTSSSITSLINIKNCFSTGQITASGSGGIISANAGAGVGGPITISNCYSTTNIPFGGGITGNSSRNIQVINCYSLGNITGGNTGGIFGSITNICTAQNCYSAGSITGSGAGGIFGPSGSGNTTLNCYAANGSWSDAAAIANLQNIGWAPGNVWGSLATNTPYVLVGFGATPYTLDNIDPATKTLIQTFSQTVQAGDSTPAALAVNYKTFAIEAGGDPTIMIANSPSPTGGIITTTTSTPAGTYTLYIYAVDDYTTTTYNLTVNAAPTPPTPAGGAGAETTIPPCCQANICNKNPQESSYSGEIIANKRAGNTINTSVANFYNGVAEGGRTVRSQPIFKSYYQYMIYLQGKTR